MTAIAKSQVTDRTKEMLKQVLQIDNLSFDKNFDDTLDGLGLNDSQIKNLPSLVTHNFRDFTAVIEEDVIVQATTVKELRDKIWEGILSGNKVPCMSKDQALDLTKKMLVGEHLAIAPISSQSLRGSLPEGLQLNDNQIRWLKDPIENEYFHDVCALVDIDDLVKAKTVSGLRDKIWRGIPADNKCAGEI